MKKILFILSFVFSSFLFSQTINWSGVVSDNNGDPMENTNLILKFSILETGNNNLIYSEAHPVQTNSAGFVNAEIGNGIAIQGDFSTIDWSEKYNLKTELDAGNGNVVLGTSEMKSVPYANGAITAQEIKKGNSGVSVGNGEVKMYLGNGANSASLDTDGILKLSGLTGSGSRELIADQYGNIRRKQQTTVTKYLSISGAALAGDNDDFHPQYGVYSTIAGFNRMQAPVYLPDNSVITNLKVVYFDNSTADMNISLFSHSDTSPTGTIIADVNSVNGTQWQTINSATSTEVDNQNNSYVLSVHCANWEGSYTKAGIRRVVITYQVNE